MNKTIFGILAVLCLGLVGANAFEIQNYEKLQNIYTNSAKAVDVNDISGEVSLMTTSGVQASPVVITNIGHYVNGNCKSAKIWAWDNAINLFKAGKKTEGDYRLNLQTCNVEQLRIVKQLHNGEKTGETSIWENGEFKGKVDVHAQNVVLKKVWTPIDINTVQV